MANNYFQFKQFKVTQDKCAMKVCTDACIFGAYVQPSNAARILDIGTGTGLLSLMLAQKTDVSIDAIEIDEAAFLQARRNFEDSPWPQNLQVFNSAVQEYYSPQHYDLIISNPPFFPNHLKSKNQKKNQALHHESLTFEELANSVKRLLAPNGIFWVLLPYYETLKFIVTVRSYGLYPHQQLFIRNRPGEQVIRVISSFQFSEIAVPPISELIIRTEANEYTPAFKKLLKDFYLIF